MPKTAKTKDISEKRRATKPVEKTLGSKSSLNTLILSLGDKFGKVEATRKRKNPYRAVSADGKNIAFGKTKEEAVKNLSIGIANRK